MSRESRRLEHMRYKFDPIGQAQFLNRLVSKPRIYATERFRVAFEA